MFTAAQVRTKLAVVTHVQRSLLAAFLALAIPVPAFFAAKAPIHAAWVHILATLAITAVACLAASRLASRVTAFAGAVVLGVCLWLLTVVSYPGGVEVIAVPFGAGLGLLVAPELPPRHVEASTPRRRRWLPPAVAPALVLSASFAVFWTGSTAPRATWFGSLHSHGDRNKNLVALTFDDGPNPGYTLEIAGILDAHGAKGTFFEVGKAVAQRPDITAALVADGHVVGNHSYLHDAVRYLDPRYPELDRAERVFVNQAGVCPALFRPPHGTHTPFMSHVVTSRGMNLVTWDDSAQDWIEHDPQRLAANILANVRPGSIILLHDGIDGNIPADRSVVLEALPAILDGLAAKGLTPVTLDKLLNVPAYLTPEQCARFRLSSEAAVSLRPDVVESEKRGSGAGR